MSDPTLATTATHSTGSTSTGSTGALTPAHIDLLKGSMDKLGEGIASLTELAKRPPQSPPPPPPPPPAEEDEGSDLLDDATLETLPRRVFAEKLLENFNKTLAKQLAPLTDGINKATVAAGATAAKIEFEKIRDEHSDFVQWKDEMIAIANAHPTLQPRQIYALARASDPEKAGKIDKEIADKKAEENKKARASNGGEPAARTRRSSSFTPGGEGGAVKPGTMTPKDAADRAWDETVARFGDPFKQ